MNIVEKLCKWSLSYWIVKDVLTIRLFDAYFKKVKETNKKNIPRDTPALIAPNHQNALMDPMAFAVHLPDQNIFLARADVFKKPWARKVLTWAKILPIYRIRDGVESLKKNEEVFDHCVEVLNRNRNVVMFPEGNHGRKRMLRPLVKGVFRIAFKAQSKYGNSPGIKILPVGVDYKHFQKFRQTLLINYGEPIEVSDYWDLFEENPVNATNALKEKLSEEIKKLIIHIETEEFYEVYMGMRSIYNRSMREKLDIKSNDLYSCFKADKTMIEKLDNTLSSEPEKIKDLANNFGSYTKLRDKLNLRDWVFSKKRYSVLINIINLLLCISASPMFLLGLLNNWPQFFIPPKMAKTVKDPQFVSTMKWGTGAGLLIVYYLILGVLTLIFAPFLWLKVILLILMPVSGILALTIRKIVIKSIARIKYTFLRKKNNDLKEAVDLYNRIITQMDSITN